MDTSSYTQGIVAGGVLIFPTYVYVPPGQVVEEEVICLPSTAIPTFYLEGNVTPKVIIYSQNSGKN